MGRKIELNKDIFNRGQYEKVIDTSFSQLVDPALEETTAEVPTVEEFFEDYNTLFFEIPKTGENSHETLIVQSTEYIDFSPVNDEIIALQEEITSLREEILELRQQSAENELSGASDASQELAELSTTNSTPTSGGSSSGGSSGGGGGY